jgi:hypothetical protein
MQHDRLERDPSLGQRLQGLPPEQPPYGFAEFQRRTRTRAGNRGRHAFPRLPFLPRLVIVLAGVAALAVFSLPLLEVWPRGQAERMLADRERASESTAQDPDAAAAGQAQAMETWLTNLPAEPAVVRVGARAAVTSLEDRIALLDDALSAERAAHAEPDRLVAIERQRGQLLRSLVQVRYAENLAIESR